MIMIYKNNKTSLIQFKINTVILNLFFNHQINIWIINYKNIIINFKTKENKKLIYLL
jgi:hypothetical protein